MSTTFRVLYREFLFRVTDLDLLAERGDLLRLVGQAAALLAAFSFTTSLSALQFAMSKAPPEQLLVHAWAPQHFLIATNMLVVALFALLAWDQLLPGRRDAQVLAPLPVRPWAAIAAKLAAVGTSLAAVVLTTNCFTGLAFPLFFIPAAGGFLAGLRTFAAHWCTLVLSGAFVFGTLLWLQAAMAQLLPRKQFLRWSAWAQVAMFCTVLAVYFLQPILTHPQAFASPANQALLRRLPSYWFFGLFHVLNGDASPIQALLALRAEAGCALASLGGLLMFITASTHLFRKTVEEPDIVPTPRHRTIPLPLCHSPATAVLLFTVRSLARGRLHRMILAGYLGVGGAIALSYLSGLITGRAVDPWWQPNVPVLVASVVMLCFAVVGVRTVFDLPVTPRASWIFRVAAGGTEPQLRATWCALACLSVAPVCLTSGAVLFSVWPLPAAVGHMVWLALAGVTLVSLALHRFHKVPFTCTYLPGKANIHVMAGGYVLVLVAFTDLVARTERVALENVGAFACLMTVTAAAGVGTTWRTRGEWRHASLRFEDTEEVLLASLHLRRDGDLPQDCEIAWQTVENPSAPKVSS